MKRILVPTDFSPIADNALNYAIEIAAKFTSEILLFHVFSFNRKVDRDWSFSYDEQPYIDNIKRKMNLTELRFKGKLTRKGVSIQTRVQEGVVSTLFDSTVKELGVDLIIMGSKGATGLEKVIFGSVAAQAIEIAEVPVLIIPPGHSFSPFEHIVLATDLNNVALSVLFPLQEIAVKFGAKVTILNINEALVSDERRFLDLSLKNLETTFIEVNMSNSINESINEFISENECDLLCMIRREKDFFKSFFQRSITKTQVFDNKFPLLVLPEK